MSALYKLINPPVKLLLRSPLHGLLSNNTLLLQFKGKKSGRTLSTPISYYIKDNTAHCFTAKSFVWWKNLTNGQTVDLTIAGTQYRSQPIVEADDEDKKRSQLDAFLRAVPRDAAHSNVRLLGDGSPDPNDINAAAGDMVFLQFPLELR